MSKSFLIDVRSPEEFATGGIDGAINIEYTNIGQLAADPRVGRGDDITLYCRSGRRSAIALDTLKSLGFRKARDIGNLEEAQETLQREKESKAKPAPEPVPASTDVDEHLASKESLESSTKTLLDGLRALE
ncbi:Rhodanese-like domain-containing protein [Phyllosticta citrichinensis]|uniref:Rhodanese-like domain-containing protein n=1 Tax=Phyllosticta citrichinensis TaxID=1130410 RepID=A0ABR1XKF8_9PEZI